MDTSVYGCVLSNTPVCKPGVDHADMCVGPSSTFGERLVVTDPMLVREVIQLPHEWAQTVSSKGWHLYRCLHCGVAYRKARLREMCPRRVKLGHMKAPPRKRVASELLAHEWSDRRMFGSRTRHCLHCGVAYRETRVGEQCPALKEGPS